MRTIEKFISDYQIEKLSFFEKEIDKHSYTIQYFTAEMLEDAISAGIEFAQRWIPVEEDLPKKKELNYSDVVFVKCNEITYPIPGYYNYNNETWILYYGQNKFTVTHFRAIELK